MNLIEDPWIPVRRASGKREKIPPWSLTEEIVQDPVVELASPRPDFNASTAQFLIGLGQTLGLIQNKKDHLRLMDAPLTAEELKKRMTPLVPFFNLDGKGPRFMQERGLTKASGIGALLLDSPGENTLKHNTDFFVKRGKIQGLCPSCAAQALYNMQVNSPSGGKGYMTSIRGGGPLTTLVWLTAEGDEPPLWDQILANMMEENTFMGNHELAGEPLSTAIAQKKAHLRFPWMDSETGLTKKGKRTYVEIHPLQYFWSMPRRYELDFENREAGNCDLCRSESEGLVSGLRQRDYGLDYSGSWDHPLSPYNINAKGEHSALRPKEDGFSYRHWNVLTLGVKGKDSKRPARIVQQVINIGKNHSPRTGIWAFGFEVDKAKVLNWHEAKLPLYVCKCPDESHFRVEVENWVKLADRVANLLGQHIGEAWYGKDFRDRQKSYNDSFLKRLFFPQTEPEFYRLVEKLAEIEDFDRNEELENYRREWLGCLQRTAKDLFVEWAESGPAEEFDFGRIAKAKNKLYGILHSQKTADFINLKLYKKEEHEEK